MSNNSNDNVVSMQLSLDLARAQREFTQFQQFIQSQTLTTNLGLNAGARGLAGGFAPSAANVVNSTATVAPPSVGGGRPMMSRPNVNHSNTAHASSVTYQGNHVAIPFDQAYSGPVNAINNGVPANARPRLGQALFSTMSATYADWQAAQNRGFVGGLPEFVSSKHEQRQGAMEARALADDQRRTERLERTHDNGVRDYQRNMAWLDQQNDRFERMADDGHRRFQRDMGWLNAEVDRDDRRRDNGYRNMQRDLGWMERDQRKMDLLHSKALEENAQYDYDRSFRGRAAKVLPGIDDMSMYGRGLMRGGMVLAGRVGSDFLSAATNERMTGRPDMLGNAQAVSGLLGGGIGLAIGSLAGPWGGAIGASQGATLGSAAGAFFAAGDIRNIMLRQNLMPVTGGLANLARDWGGYQNSSFAMPNYGLDGGSTGPDTYITRQTWRNPVNEGTRRLAGRAFTRSQAIANQFFGELDGNGNTLSNEKLEFAATAEQLGSMYSSSFQALVAAGIDPEQAAAFGVDVAPTRGNAAVMARGGATIRSGMARYRRDMSSPNEVKSAGGMIDILRGTGMVDIGSKMQGLQAAPGGTDRLYQVIAENAAKIFGNDGPEIMSKSVLPILSTVQQTGGNAVDQLMKYGALATSQYQQAITPVGQAPGVDLRTLMTLNAGLQQQDRSLAFAGTQVRNSATGIAAGIAQKTALVAAAPGGLDSLTYAQLSQQGRSANLAAFGEQGMMSYDLQMAKLSGERDRINMMPFSPANPIRNQIAISRTAGSEAARMDRWYRQHGGELSESETVAWQTRREGLETQRMSVAAMLSEGFVNKLPALSSNAPRGGGRFDSLTLAAENLRLMGSPVASFGAMGAGQRHMQDELFSQAGGDPSMRGRSRTFGYSNGGGAGYSPIGVTGTAQPTAAHASAASTATPMAPQRYHIDEHLGSLRAWNDSRGMHNGQPSAVSPVMNDAPAVAPSTGGLGNNDKVVQLLQQLVDAVKGGGSTPRSGEMTNQLNGAIQRRGQQNTAYGGRVK